MSINKNAFIRYQTLDKCLRKQGRQFFIEDLLEECNKALLDHNPSSSGIQKRQVQYDIQFMESEAGWSCPIGRFKDGKRVFYRYEDPSYSIKNQPLNETEAEQIRSALQILSRFQGMPQFSWVNEMIPKLEQKFQLKTDSAKIISFDNNEYLTGIENLGSLFNYILYKKAISITYKSFKRDKEVIFAIHPYHLKQYNNRWFLFGLNDETHSIYNLALDRIISISEANLPYIENSEIDFNEYFEEIVGVTKPAGVNPEVIKLQFSSEQAPYILTKPIHGSMKKISHDDNGLIVSILVIPNYELSKLILSFGESVKVLQPQELKEIISKSTLESLKHYQKNDI
jgi:predicted DNA-binding transcriptional regulator YafY